MSESSIHCWKCKASLDGVGDTCPNCGVGTVCPECGTCRCDYDEDFGTGPSARAPDPREIFQRLIDQAEEIKISSDIDLDPAEQDLLACVLQESGGKVFTSPALILESLQTSEFQNISVRKLAEEIFPLSKIGVVFNADGLRKLIRDEPIRNLALELLGRVYDVATFPLYIELVHNQAVLNDTLTTLAPSAQQLLKGDLDLPKLVDVLGAARSGMVGESLRSMKIRSERDELLPFFRAIESRQQESDFVGFDTGFLHLNRVINGLYAAFLVLAGPPGSGKTTLVIQICRQVAKNNNGVLVIFFSFEQSKDALRIKILSQLSMVDNRSIGRGKHNADTEAWERGIAPF